jgi:hypothetical protein
MDILAAIKREEKKARKAARQPEPASEWGTIGGKSIARLCGARSIGAKKRVLSAAGRAAIARAAKKR